MLAGRLVGREDGLAGSTKDFWISTLPAACDFVPSCGNTNNGLAHPAIVIQNRRRRGLSRVQLFAARVVIAAKDPRDGDPAALARSWTSAG